MNQLITEHLATWTTAPKGIKKLRELILDLAVRGLLVPQDANDEPASALLTKIAAEKTQLVSEGKIKPPKPLATISEEEKPFNLPMGWEFCRFSSLINSIISGGTPSKINSQFWDGDIPWASVKDLGKSKYLEKTQDYITQKGLDTGSKLADINDVIICTRMGLGKIAIAKVNVAINQDLKAVKLTSLLNIEFFLNFFATLNIKGTGTTVAGIKQEELLSYVFALPPLAEQQRIVAKVDELMQLCDQLEEKQIGSEVMHRQLVNCLLTTLTEASDAQAFQAAWSRIAANFDNLFTTEHSIEQLKQTILQLAVMGKLIPQNPNDEPASELLNKIATEKARLITEGKIKKQNPLPKISEQEKPFSLPDGWEWTRWDNIAMKIGDIDHKMPDQISDGIPYVSPRDFFPRNVIDFDGAKKISHEDFLKLSAKIQPQRGDIIYPRYGTIGENRLVETDREFLASYSCCVIKTLHGFIAPQYQFIFSISELTKTQAKKAENKTTQANVGIKSIQQYLVPLPPLAEQHRIVTKVDELLTLCDQLKTKLANAQILQQQLAETLVQQAVA